MRLQQEEIVQIRDALRNEFGKYDIYIFGSQLKADKRGGDIDIFVIPNSRENLLNKESKAKFVLEDRLLKPIDILIHSDFGREIEQIALKGIKI